MIGTNNAGSGGGGLNFSNQKAVIHVSAEIGSTVTFKKEGIVVKELLPEQSHVTEEDLSLADYYFQVSASNFGSWTVEATLYEYIASETITVDAVEQYDIFLRYDKYLFNEGRVDRYDWLRVGPDLENWSITDTIYIDSKSGASYSGLVATPAFDLSDYATVHFYVPTRGSTGGSACYLSRNPDLTMDVSDATIINVGEHTIDVTAMSGSYYFGIACRMNAYAYISKVWFTRK